MINIEITNQISGELVWGEKRYLNYDRNQIECWYSFVEKNSRKIAFLIRPLYNKKSDETEYVIVSVLGVEEPGILEKESPMYKFRNTGGYLLKGIQTIHDVKSTLDDAKKSASKIARSMYPKCNFAG